MAPAADAVLSTPELLEAVLLDVDARTLLLSASRVCRTWHAVLAASLPLQRALFLHPDDDPPLPDDDDDDDDDDSEYIHPKAQNPFLRALFPAWFENTRTFEPPVCAGVNPVHAYPATAMMGYKRFQELPLYEASVESGPGDDNPFLRPGASWRRMLVSQPACRTVVASVGKTPGMSLGKTLGEPHVFRHDDGLRMGELYETTLRHCSRHSVSGFMVVWPEGGDEGYVDLARHLRRMVGILPVVFEMGFSLVWGHRPDLVVQMVFTKGKIRPGEIEGDDLGGFWERCGSRVFNVGEGDSQGGSARERELDRIGSRVLPNAPA